MNPGIALLPRLDRARVVVSIGDDLLGPGPFQVWNVARWAEARRREAGGLLLVAEPTPTLTGTAASDRLAVPPSRLDALVRAIGAAFGVGDHRAAAFRARARLGGEGRAADGRRRRTRAACRRARRRGRGRGAGVGRQPGDRRPRRHCDDDTLAGCHPARRRSVVPGPARRHAGGRRGAPAHPRFQSRIHRAAGVSRGAGPGAHALSCRPVSRRDGAALPLARPLGARLGGLERCPRRRRNRNRHPAADPASRRRRLRAYRALGLSGRARRPARDGPGHVAGHLGRRFRGPLGGGVARRLRRRNGGGDRRRDRDATAPGDRRSGGAGARGRLRPGPLRLGRALRWGALAARAAEAADQGDMGQRDMPSRRAGLAGRRRQRRSRRGRGGRSFGERRGLDHARSGCRYTHPVSRLWPDGRCRIGGRARLRRLCGAAGRRGHRSRRHLAAPRGCPGWR